tara:strand:- start:127 stop:270 length:144 start_codon:yes stop_codon:yes gene_type:complete
MRYAKKLAFALILTAGCLILGCDAGSGTGDSNQDTDLKEEYPEIMNA